MKWLITSSKVGLSGTDEFTYEHHNYGEDPGAATRWMAQRVLEDYMENGAYNTHVFRDDAIVFVRRADGAPGSHRVFAFRLVRPEPELEIRDVRS